MKNFINVLCFDFSTIYTEKKKIARFTPPSPTNNGFPGQVV